MNRLKPASERRCVEDKVWPFRTCSTTKREQPEINIKDDLLVSAQISLRPSYSIRQERKWWCKLKSIVQQHFAEFNQSPTK